MPTSSKTANYNNYYKSSELRLTNIWVLFENRPALYFCNYKENKKNTRMLDTLFIDYSIDNSVPVPSKIMASKKKHLI